MPAVVGVPSRIGVVVAIPGVTFPVHESVEPGVVASRLPAEVSAMEVFSWATIFMPGGMFPVIVQDPTFIVLVIPNASGVIVTPTVASKSGRSPVGFVVMLEDRIVAPAMELTAPSAAAAAAADLRRVPTGDVATNSSASAASLRTGRALQEGDQRDGGQVDPREAPLEVCELISSDLFFS